MPKKTLLAILACALWATAFAAIKVGLNYMPPFQFAGVRFIIAGLLILPFIGSLPNELKAVRLSWPKILLVGTIQTFLQYALFYKGMELIPGALGAMVVGTSPLFVAIAAHFLIPNDGINPRKLLSIAIGIGGIAVLTVGRHGMGATGVLALWGIIILMVNNLLSGFGNILVATDRHRVPALVMSSFSMIFGGIMLYLLGITVEEPQGLPLNTEFLISLGWLSFLSAAAISIWYTLLREPGVKVSELNVWKFIIPVLGATLSWVILPDENPTLWALIGMVLVGVSLVIINLGQREHGAKNLPEDL